MEKKLNCWNTSGRVCNISTGKTDYSENKFGDIGYY